MEQYANDRGHGLGIRREKPPETETLLAFKRLIEAANLQISLTFQK